MSTELARTQPIRGMDLLDRLSRSITDPQAAIEIAKQIVELETRQETLRQNRDRFEWEKLDREAKVAFADAFEKFKHDAPKILKTKHVHFESKKEGAAPTSYWHVELDKACDLLIPALLKVGITHRWKSTDLPAGHTRVTCYLRHRLGYEEEGASLAGPADQSGGKNPIQGVGSSTTYLERYTFLAACGIVPKGRDDDGQVPESPDAEAMDPATFKHLSDDMEMMATKDDLREAYHKAMKACGVTPEDLDRSDWQKRAKYRREANTFVELKNKLLGELGRRK